MESTTQVSSASTKLVWAGRILSGLLVLFMLFNSAVGLLKPDFAKAGFAHLGYPDRLAPGVTIAMLACTLIYAIPQTSILGAILLTGYLGGATASHLRVGEPFYLPVIIGVLFWLGIYLREDRLRALVPLRR
jgi:DoxX-like protein